MKLSLSSCRCPSTHYHDSDCPKVKEESSSQLPAIYPIKVKWDGMTTSLRREAFRREKIQSRYEILESHYNTCFEFNCPYCNAYVRCLAAIYGPSPTSKGEEVR